MKYIVRALSEILPNFFDWLILLSSILPLAIYLSFQHSFCESFLGYLIFNHRYWLPKQTLRRLKKGLYESAFIIFHPQEEKGSDEKNAA